MKCTNCGSENIETFATGLIKCLDCGKRSSPVKAEGNTIHSIDKESIDYSYSLDEYREERETEDTPYYDPDQKTGIEKYLAKQGIEASVFPSENLDDIYNRIHFENKKVSQDLEDQRIKEIKKVYILNTDFKYRLSLKLSSGEVSREYGFNSFDEVKEVFPLEKKVVKPVYQSMDLIDQIYQL